jgi:hypothetical protein
MKPRSGADARALISGNADWQCQRKQCILLLMKLHLTLLLTLCTLTQAQESPRLETMLMLPEPRALRTELSVVPLEAQKTVFSPAREIADVPGIEVYGKEDFQRFGLSPETFAERAKKTADRLLAQLKADLVKDADGKVLYAVYRGDRPIMACLLIAPSLPKVFQDLFGPEIWVATPDRHSLYIFPAKPEALEDFVLDLATRYEADAHAASSEIFALKTGTQPQVVASFGG